MLHPLAALLLGDFTQVNVAVELRITFCTVGVLKIRQAWPDEKADQDVLGVTRLILANFRQRNLAVGLVFNGDLRAIQCCVLRLLDCNGLRSPWSVSLFGSSTWRSLHVFFQAPTVSLTQFSFS